MNTAPSPDTRNTRTGSVDNHHAQHQHQHRGTSKDFSLSFGSRASGSQSESGISQRLDGTHNLAASSLLSSEVLRSTSGIVTSGMSEQKPPAAEARPSTATAAMTAANISPPQQPTPPPGQQQQQHSQPQQSQAPMSRRSAKNVARAAAAAVAAAATAGAVSAPNASPATAAAAASDPPKLKNANVRRNVYVSGVPSVYRSEDFRQLCQQFGRVEAAKLCVDSRHNPPKAYGFALYFSEESAAACIRGLNGSFLQGRCIQARLADYHATPQPLGDAGAAINTTLPLPSMQRDRRDTNRNRRADGTRRDSHAHPTMNGVDMSGNAVPLPMPMPFHPAAMAAAMAGHGPNAMPMSMAQYFPFMAAGSGGAGGISNPATTPGASPVEVAMAANTSPSAAYFTLTPANCSPCTDRGFGAIGTPVPGPLTASGNGPLHGGGGGTTAVAALSPASMALSPPLLSPHSNDSGSSLASPTATTMANTTSGGPAGDALSRGGGGGGGVHPHSVMSPYAFPFPNMGAMMPNAAMAGASGATSAEWTTLPPSMAGTTAYMCYPLPGGGYGAYATTAAAGAAPGAAPVGMTAFGGSPMPSGMQPGSAGSPVNPFMYFPIGAVPMAGGAAAAAGGVPAMPGYYPGGGGATGMEGYSAMPPNIIMMDNGMGAQLQMLR
ncbi:RNA-binding protein [Novymonas esmeraldas]|uniref:RNA-binding protein n=1 Tax=Novymonas esmeraldas TaxID=1808958 RepID=A0AAW0EJH7_9TRYP